MTLTLMSPMRWRRRQTLKKMNLRPMMHRPEGLGQKSRMANCQVWGRMLGEPRLPHGTVWVSLTVERKGLPRHEGYYFDYPVKGGSLSTW